MMRNLRKEVGNIVRLEKSVLYWMGNIMIRRSIHGRLLGKLCRNL